MGTRSTMVELVQDLEAIKKNYPEVENNHIDLIISEAKEGEFHDYKNKKYDCGKVELVKMLQQAADSEKNENVSFYLWEIGTKVVEGYYDETADEEDKEMMRKDLPKEMWGMLGL